MILAVQWPDVVALVMAFVVLVYLVVVLVVPEKF